MYYISYIGRELAYVTFQVIPTENTSTPIVGFFWLPSYINKINQSIINQSMNQL